MAEAWKEANLKRIKDYEAVQKAKKTVADYDPKEPNKPQWKKDNEARIKAYDAKQAKAKAAEYKMPKSTTPDMDTTQGNIGSRNSFDAGEVKTTAREETKATPAPVEERSFTVEEKSTPKEESRFSSSNPLGMKKGGSIKMAKGGKVSSASSRGDGCAQRGKTKGRMV
jgi:hypothetical protein